MIKGIPSYASPFEAGMYLAVETERSFSEMMQNIGINELHSFEENGSVVLEADAAEAAKEKKANVIINWIKARWNDLKSLVEKILTNIKNLIIKAKKKIAGLLGSDKNKNKVVEAVSRLKETSKDGKKKIFGKGFTWAGFDKAFGEGDIKKAINAYDSFAAKAAAGGINYKEEKDKIDSDIASYLNIKDDLTVSSIRDAINNIMRGEEIEIDKNYLSSNIDNIFKYATEYNQDAADLKSFLSATKKAFDNAQKTVKAAAKKDKADENLAGAAAIIKSEAVFLTAAAGAITTNLRMRVTNSIRIVLRLSLAAKEKKVKDKAESVGESAIVPSSFQTELASLFEF